MTGPQWGPEWAGPDGDLVESSARPDERVAPGENELRERALVEEALSRPLGPPGSAWTVGDEYEPDDAELVAGYLFAEQAAQAAAAAQVRARDALGGAYDPVRALDGQVEAARGYLAQIDEAEAAAGEWSEALAQQRDAAVRAGQDRETAQGRGPRAWAAARRLEDHAYDRQAHVDRVAAARTRAVDTATVVGTMDPKGWERLREVHGRVIARAGEERARLLEQEGERVAGARVALEQADQLASVTSAHQVDTAAALAARGIDPERMREAAAEVEQERRARAADEARERGDDQPGREAEQERER